MGITKHSYGRSTTDKNIIVLPNIIHSLDTSHVFLFQSFQSTLCTKVPSWCVFSYHFFALSVSFVV